MEVTRWQILSRGLRHRCPNCDAPLVFGRWLRLQDSCPRCHMRWAARDGFFLGALVWNYSLTVFGLLAPLVVLALRGWLPPTVAIVLALAIAFIFPWLFYRTSWTLWLCSYYFVLPQELPANDRGHKHEVDL